MGWLAWVAVGLVTVFGLHAQQAAAATPKLSGGIPKDWQLDGGGGGSGGSQFTPMLPWQADFGIAQALAASGGRSAAFVDALVSSGYAGGAAAVGGSSSGGLLQQAVNAAGNIQPVSPSQTSTAVGIAQSILPPAQSAPAPTSTRPGVF